MTTCPSCRAPLAAGQEYCLECGARVTARRIRPCAHLEPSASLPGHGSRGAHRGGGCNRGDGWERRRSCDRDGDRWLRNRAADVRRRVACRTVRRRRVADGRGRLDDRAGVTATDRRPVCSARASARRASEGIDRRRPARLVAICQLASGLLDRLHGHLCERGRSDERPRGCSAFCAHGDRQARRPVTSRCLVGRLEIPTL